MKEFIGVLMLYAIIAVLSVAVIAEEVSHRLRRMSAYTLMYAGVLALVMYLLVSLEIGYTANRLLIRQNTELEIQNKLLQQITIGIIEKQDSDSESCAPEEDAIDEETEPEINL